VKTWRELNYPPIRIAINLSTRQVNRDLPATIRAALSSSGSTECWLDLEITESLLMLDVEEGVDILLELRSMGIHISVDDFGTGYSSLSYLKRLPIDAVKIDRSFVLDLATQARDGRLIGAMIQLCHALGLGTIAEGVETPEQREALGQMGCGAYQGFVLSRALPAGEFAERFLQARGRSLQYAEA
jgi:EAL domain-containing protein (putative c-di-GMP-specific phosphodiesterase class I)